MLFSPQILTLIIINLGTESVGIGVVVGVAVGTMDVGVDMVGVEVGTMDVSVGVGVVGMGGT